MGSVRKILARLLPSQADNTIQGMKLPVYLFTLIAIVSTVRSCFIFSLPTAEQAALPEWICRSPVPMALSLPLHYEVVRS
jgi:hypothetical protein